MNTATPKVKQHIPLKYRYLLEELTTVRVFLDCRAGMNRRIFEIPAEIEALTQELKDLEEERTYLPAVLEHIFEQHPHEWEAWESQRAVGHPNQQRFPFLGERVS